MIPEHPAHRAGDTGAIPGDRPLPAPWTEPLPSTAHRRVGLKSRGALRGRTLRAQAAKAAGGARP